MELTCITCPKGCTLTIELKEGKILSIQGNGCPRGIQYAENEILHPVRMVTSTIQVIHGIHDRCPVMTSKPVAKEKIFEVMKEIHSLKVEAPVFVRDVFIHNVAQSGADLIATRSVQSESFFSNEKK